MVVSAEKPEQHIIFEQFVDTQEVGLVSMRAHSESKMLLKTTPMKINEHTNMNCIYL